MNKHVLLVLLSFLTISAKGAEHYDAQRWSIKAKLKRDVAIEMKRLREQGGVIQPQVIDTPDIKLLRKKLEQDVAIEMDRRQAMQSMPGYQEKASLKAKLKADVRLMMAKLRGQINNALPEQQVDSPLILELKAKLDADVEAYLQRMRTKSVLDVKAANKILLDEPVELPKADEVNLKGGATAAAPEVYYVSLKAPVSDVSKKGGRPVSLARLSSCGHTPTESPVLPRAKFGRKTSGNGSNVSSPSLRRNTGHESEEQTIIFGLDIDLNRGQQIQLAHELKAKLSQIQSKTPTLFREAKDELIRKLHNADSYDDAINVLSSEITVEKGVFNLTTKKAAVHKAEDAVEENFRRVQKGDSAALLQARPWMGLRDTLNVLRFSRYIRLIEKGYKPLTMLKGTKVLIVSGDPDALEPEVEELESLNEADLQSAQDILLVGSQMELPETQLNKSNIIFKVIRKGFTSRDVLEIQQLLYKVIFKLFYDKSLIRLQYMDFSAIQEQLKTAKNLEEIKSAIGKFNAEQEQLKEIFKTTREREEAREVKRVVDPSTVVVVPGVWFNEHLTVLSQQRVDPDKSLAKFLSVVSNHRFHCKYQVHIDELVSTNKTGVVLAPFSTNEYQMRAYIKFLERTSTGWDFSYRIFDILTGNALRLKVIEKAPYAFFMNSEICWAIPRVGRPISLTIPDITRVGSWPNYIYRIQSELTKEHIMTPESEITEDILSHKDIIKVDGGVSLPDGKFIPVATLAKNRFYEYDG